MTTVDSTQRPGPLAHAAVWLCIPVAELIWTWSSFPAPTATQFLIEFAAFGLLGAAQYRFAKDLWLTTLLWPALLVGMVGIAVTGPTAPTHWLVFYAAGVVLLTSNILRDAGRFLQIPAWVAILAALSSLGSARYLDVRHLLAVNSAERGDTSDDVADGTTTTTAAATATGPLIVLISVDTLRADAALEMKSYQRLAAVGGSWPRAMSTSSWTMPALGSLVTGMMPEHHGAICLENGHCQGLYSDVPTLASQLQDAGYRTTAIVSNPWIHSGTGFARGFDRFVSMGDAAPFRMLFSGQPWGAHHQDAATLVPHAIELLADLPDEGGLLWLHLLDPHMPYLNSDDPAMQAVTGPALRDHSYFSPDSREKFLDAYAGEVAHVDAQIMTLLDQLEARGLMDRAVVVLTSDHGEEFWEHGGIEHGHSHHAEVVDIPLVIVAPGMTPGERDTTASLMDVTPTLLAAAGLESHGFDLRETLPADRVATAFGNLVQSVQRSARDHTDRVIVDGDLPHDPPSVRRFHLVDDPEELIQRPPDERQDLIDAAMGLSAPAKGEAGDFSLKALEALGYVQ